MKVCSWRSLPLRSRDRVWSQAKASEFLEIAEPLTIRRQPEQFGLDKDRGQALSVEMMRLQREEIREVETEG